METHVFSEYLGCLNKKWEQQKSRSATVGLTPLLSEDEFYALCRDFAEKVLQKIADSNPAATVTLEKTPQHVRHAQFILALFPKARFIHIVRDPRSVVSSLRAAAHSWGSTWASSIIRDNAKLWCCDVTSGREIRYLTNRYREILYEDPYLFNTDFALQLRLAALTFDFVFTQPYLSLRISNKDDVWTFVFFLIVAMVAAEVGIRGRRGGVAARESRSELDRLVRVAELSADGAEADDVVPLLGADEELIPEPFPRTAGAGCVRVEEEDRAVRRLWPALSRWPRQIARAPVEIDQGGIGQLGLD
jgi:hypothetical protein